jgi:hypothetical protein
MIRLILTARALRAFADGFVAAGGLRRDEDRL